MYRPRRIESHADWSDADQIKLYTISAHQRPVLFDEFLPRLADVKAQKKISWASTPAFAILHDGVAPYLILAWWGNDNELFTSVSVKTASGWAEDPARYSFCVFEMEIMWHERNFFIESVYCAAPDLDAYRTKRFSNV
ncbi:MAG: hypothetical protein HY308_01340 [Gammaproteobacteria bacterium]|nr:hypothetical protein [Gammaproteobacteria bacterium]